MTLLLVCVGFSCNEAREHSRLWAQLDLQEKEIADLTTKINELRDEKDSADTLQADYRRAREITDRLASLVQVLGFSFDAATGTISIDHDRSRAVEGGYDPDVIDAVNRKFMVVLGQAEPDETDPGFPEFKGGTFTPPEPEKTIQAEQAWVVLQHIFWAGRSSTLEYSGYPALFLYRSNASKGEKASARLHLADEIRSDLRKLPVRYASVSPATDLRRIADYIETQDPSLLVPVGSVPPQLRTTK